MFQAID